MGLYLFTLLLGQVTEASLLINDEKGIRGKQNRPSVNTYHLTEGRNSATDEDTGNKKPEMRD